MATSEVEICNSALVKVGGQRILALSGTDKSSQLCNEQYAKIRDEVLRSHPWKFATARVALAPLSTAPIQIDDDFTYQFQLPSDVLRVLKVSLPGLDDPWTIEGNKILAAVNTLSIKYIKQVTDVTLFDSNFCEVLAWRLAADLAYSFTNSLTATDEMMKFYRSALMEARSFDAQEAGNIQQVESSEWFDSRY